MTFEEDFPSLKSRGRKYNSGRILFNLSSLQLQRFCLDKSKVREAWIKFCKYSNVGEKEPYFVFYKTDKKRFEKELGLTSEELKR